MSRFKIAFGTYVFKIPVDLYFEFKSKCLLEAGKKDEKNSVITGRLRWTIGL